MTQTQWGAAGPHNLEVERSLLGILITHNDSLFEITSIISSRDFFDAKNGELFNLIRDLIERGQTVTSATLMHDMAQDRDIGGINAYEYIRTIQDGAPHFTMAINLATTVQDLSRKRFIADLCEATKERAINAPASLSWVEVIGSMESDISGMIMASNEAGTRKMAEVGDEMLRKIHEASMSEQALGVDLGLACAQDLTGPLYGGDLMTLIGASGSGKSALSQQIGRHVSGTVKYVDGKEHPNVVLMFSAEMRDTSVTGREWAATTGIPSSRIARGVFDYQEQETLAQANADLRDLPFYIDSSRAPTTAAVRAKATRQKRKTGLALIIIDHLLYIRKADPRQGEFDAIRSNLQDLKQIAKDLDVPILVLCPTKMEYGAGVVRRPMVSDAYGGSSVEQESDIIIMVHREEYMLARREPTKGINEREQNDHRDWEMRLEACKGKAEIILGKRREGSGFGIRECFFDAKTTRFFDRLTREIARSLPQHLMDAPPVKAYGDILDRENFEE